MINGKNYGMAEELKNRFPQARFEEDFSFARHTTIGCGGCAALAVSQSDAKSAASLLGFLSDNGIPHCFLGAGANVLPEDAFYHGVVVRFDRLNELSVSGNTLSVGAGVPLGRALRFARERELSGMEPFTGIPATVGGGICMNAGIAVRHFSDLAESVTAIVNGRIEEIPVSACAFGEKSSLFQKGIAVVGARLKLIPSSQAEIAQVSERYRLRRRSLPKGRSMGCTFVNPPGVSAGKLIEECGLKGFSVGKAFVSDVHANFIINRGTSAADVACIVARVKEVVFKEKGVRLREEIKRLPPHDNGHT